MNAVAQIDLLARNMTNEGLSSVIKYMSFLYSPKMLYEYLHRI